MSASDDALAQRLRALEDENRRFVAMLDALPDHFLLIDRALRLMFVNKAAAEVVSGLVGRARDQLVGVSAIDHTEPESFRRHSLELLDRALAARAAEVLRAATPAAQRRSDDVECAGRIYRFDAPETDADVLRERDPGLYAVLRELGVTTAIVIPFVVLGAPVAVATFAY